MEQMTLFWVLGGLLILTLVLASIAQRYHAYVEERRRQIERILQRIVELEEIVRRLQGLPLPPELMPLLYRDILARLYVIKQVYSRQPGIDERIAGTTRAQATAEHAPVGSTELHELEFEQLMRGLGQVHWMLQERRFVAPITEDERSRLMQGIAMSRAESHYRYHRRLAERRAQEGQLHQALWHCNQVRRFLLDEAPENELIDTWYREFDERYRAILKLLDDQSTESSPEPTSE
jgi:hypothetical protein